MDEWGLARLIGYIGGGAAGQDADTPDGTAASDKQVNERFHAPIRALGIHQGKLSMIYENYNTLSEVVSDMIENGDKPIKAIAADIGKPYSTLKRELNVDDDMAKLGADVLLGIMRSCGSVVPLEWLAERMGYIVKPKDFAEPDKKTWPEECVDDAVCGGKMNMLMREKAHPSIVSKSAEEWKDEIDQTNTRYRRDYNQARQ